MNGYRNLFKRVGLGVPIGAVSLASEPSVGSLITAGVATRIALGCAWATFDRLTKPEEAFRKRFVKHPDLDERTRRFWPEYTRRRTTIMPMTRS